MPPVIQDALESFNWRVAEAEYLLSDEQYFFEVFNRVIRIDHRDLIRAALGAYLRENSD